MRYTRRLRRLESAAPPPPTDPQEFEIRVRTVTVSPEEALRLGTEWTRRADGPESMGAISFLVVETDPPPVVRRFIPAAPVTIAPAPSPDVESPAATPAPRDIEPAPPPAPREPESYLRRLGWRGR